MKRYKPPKGRDYYMINSRFEVRQTTHTGSKKSKARIAAGNSFKTHKDAEKFKEAVVEGSVVEIEKAQFDKRIAFAYGFITAAFIGVLLWSAIR